MSATPDDRVEEVTGSRVWLEDDPNTTAEAEQRHWEEVKRGSDELLAYYWANYGKWGTITTALRRSTLLSAFQVHTPASTC